MDNKHTMVEFIAMCCSGDEVEEKGSGESDDISVYRFMSSTNVPLKGGAYVPGNLERRKNG